MKTIAMGYAMFAAIFAVLIGAGFVGVQVLAAERGYKEDWCRAAGGQTEYVLDDRTRVDCVTDTHAVEVEFAAKWAESIGQALFYAAKTGKRAGIVLIIKTDHERRYLERLRRAIAAYCLTIDVWIIDA